MSDFLTKTSNLDHIDALQNNQKKTLSWSLVLVVSCKNWEFWYWRFVTELWTLLHFPNFNHLLFTLNPDGLLVLIAISVNLQQLMIGGKAGHATRIISTVFKLTAAKLHMKNKRRETGRMAQPHLHFCWIYWRLARFKSANVVTWCFFFFLNSRRIGLRVMWSCDWLLKSSALTTPLLRFPEFNFTKYICPRLSQTTIHSSSLYFILSERRKDANFWTPSWPVGQIFHYSC